MSDRDAVARSDALDEKLADNPVIMNLVKIAKQHSLILKILMFSIIFDLTLSGAFIFLEYQASHTADQAKRAAENASSARTQAYNQCLAGNDSRHTQLQLWEFILSIPPDPTLTPEEVAHQQQEAKAFRKYVERKLAPRDCHSLRPIKTKSGAIRFAPSPIEPSQQTMEATGEPTMFAMSPAPQENGGTSTPQPAPSPSPTQTPSHSASPSPAPLVQVCVKRICITPPPTLFLIGA